MKADQNKVTSLLRDTVLLLCKNGFNYKIHVKVQGLLGITLDNDEVVLVHVNETVAKSDTEPEDATEEDGEENTSYEPPAKATPPARRASKRRHSTLARSADKTTIPPSNKQKSAKQSSDARFKAVQSTSGSTYMPDAKQLAEPNPANERITLKLEKFDEAQHEADLNLNKSFEDDSQDNDNMHYSDSDQVADEYNSNDMVSSRLKITLTGRNWHVIIKLQLGVGIYASIFKFRFQNRIEEPRQPHNPIN